MDKQKQIQQEVDKTLETMNHMETLEAGPYFYTRLESKLKSSKREKRYFRIPNIWTILNEGLKPAFIIILILINVISALFFLMKSPNRQSRIENSINFSFILEEYSLNPNTYDIDLTDKIIDSGRAE